LRLGYLRQSYTSRMKMEFYLKNWDVAEKTGVTEQLTKSLASALSVDMTKVSLADGGEVAPDPLTLIATVDVDDFSQYDSRDKIDEDVRNAVKDVNDEWISGHPSSTCKTYANFPIDAHQYVAATVDFDMVIQGVDLDDLTANCKRQLFALDLVTKIRQGVNSYLVTPLPTEPGKSEIDVTISPGLTLSSFYVIVKVPVVSDGILSPLFTQLQDDLPEVYANVQKEVRALDSLKYFSSWTMENVKVTAPGVMVDELA